MRQSDTGRMEDTSPCIEKWHSNQTLRRKFVKDCKMKLLDMTMPQLICHVIGHKISQVEMVLFEIKNNPNNVARHGYSTITCPRCKRVFDPTPENDNE